MNTIKRTIATLELFLVLPATLFMTALFVRNLQPTQHEPARSARLVVEWFSARVVLGLYVFLIALPLVALVVGCTAVVRSWRREAELRQAALITVAAVRPHLATLLTAGSTLLAGSILAIVALHLITD